MLCLLLSGPLHRWHYQWDFESAVINSYTGVPPRLFAPPALLIVMLHRWIIKMRSRALQPTWGGWEAVLFRSCSQVNSQQIFIVEWLAATCLLHCCNFRVMCTKLLQWNTVSNPSGAESHAPLYVSKLQHTLILNCRNSETIGNTNCVFVEKLQ